MIAKRQSAVRPRIEVSAFAAVLLALLWAFIAEYWLFAHQYQSWILVKTAVAYHAVPMTRAADEDAIRITITRDGRYFFRSDQTSPELLPMLIQRALAAGAEKRIYLNADVRTKYANVAIVLDEAHSAGIDNISILTEWQRL